MNRIPVTWLATFLHRRGDLHPGLDGRTRSEEGIRAQRALQSERLAAAAASGQPGYLRERPVSMTLPIAGREVTISGRIDGVDPTVDPFLVEEFKTTRADAVRAHEQNRDEHWAQVRLYAGMLAREGLGADGFLLRLCYCHPDSLAVTRFEEHVTAADAERFLLATLESLEAWLERQAAHERARDARIADLEFPYGSFRPHQRAMARRAYQAFRDRESLLLEAPTGSGKTAAVLYPAIRALASAGNRRVFFLTSRSTGVHAARDALERMDPERSWLRHVQISARDKVCQQDGQPCTQRSCPMALGYYDRAREALAALLDRYALTPATIMDVARCHCVCPHELALDAAVWCDVVIGDYNYVFDPTVRLQRLAGERDAAVLVDEAHQLAPRVRDMLSLSLSRGDVRAALAEVPPQAVMRRLRAIERQLVALARPAGGAEPQPAGQDRSIEPPAALLRALERFCSALFETTIPLEAWPATLEMFFRASRWVRDANLAEPGRWLYRIRADGGAGREIRVDLDCLDPGPWIAARLGEFGGHVRFSGTVSPLPLYQLLHGLEDSPGERAGNPFRADQLEVLLVGDVPTYLQARAASLGRLVRLVEQVVAAERGDYLVAFPSFDYLRQFAGAFTAAFPHRRIEVQTPGMADTAREDFLAAFRDSGPPRLGLVVLGGVFGESVDFSGARLAGVICVGLGLPPPSLSRDALADHFDARGADGRSIAYLQPAMVKVVQMAGRLLRGPEDRGVLCLVDPRFGNPVCRQFFPSHWQPVRVRADEVGALLANFWRESATFPRLRATEQETPK